MQGETHSGAAVGVCRFSPGWAAHCVTVVHSYALPVHRASGKNHVATLWRRRVVARCNRWVCNLTPGRVFALALPTESLFKKERDESCAPDSGTPLQKNQAFSPAPSLWIGINEWNTGEYRQTIAQENSLSKQLARRNLCRAWQANQHEFYPLELRLKLVKCVKRPPVSSAPLQRSHAVINGQVFDCQDKWIQMNLGTRRRDCRTSHLDTK